MLRDFHLLDNLSEGRSVAGSVFTGDTDLLGALGHLGLSESQSRTVSVTTENDRTKNYVTMFFRIIFRRTILLEFLELWVSKCFLP